MFELLSLGLRGVRTVLEVIPAERGLYGIDWPFYHQAITLTKMLIATDFDAATEPAKGCPILAPGGSVYVGEFAEI